MLIKRQGGRTSGSKPIRRQPTQQDYRGQKITKITRPIYVGCIRETHIDPNDDFDKGVLAYFNSIKAKITDDEKGKVVQQRIGKELNLTEMINAEKQSSDDIFNRIGITKYLPGPGVGILPVGRTDIWNPAKEDFNEEDYSATYDDFVSMLGQSEADLSAFLNAGKAIGCNLTLEQLKKGMDKTKFAQIHTAYLFDILNKIEQDNNFLNADVFADAGITRLRYEEDTKEAKAAGFFLSLGNTLYWVDPFSTNGSTATIPGKIEQKIPALKKELELDKNETILKRNAGDGKLEDYVKQARLVSVNLIRYESASPITFVPLIDLSSKEEQIAVVSMGYINPITGRQQDSLFVKASKEQ